MFILYWLVIFFPQRRSLKPAIIKGVMHDYAIPLLMGIALSAACGLRAFLPLLIVSLASLSGLVALNPAFDFIGTPQAAAAFGVALALELLADKIPVVDNILDTVGIYMKHAAATILVAGLIKEWDPLLALVIGLIAGGSVSAAVHLMKSGVRAASTVVTAGAANMFISFAEDIFALLWSLMSLWLPVVGAAFAVLLVIALARLRKKASLRLCASAHIVESEKARA